MPVAITGSWVRALSDESLEALVEHTFPTASPPALLFAEVRHTIHPDVWPDPTTPLTLTARCPHPLPGLHVEAWLEARLRR